MPAATPHPIAPDLHHLALRRRQWLWGAAAALAAPAQALAQIGTPLKIGVIAPVTGNSSDFGTPMLQGIQLAVAEINAVGGYMGRPLQLVIKDDQGAPDVGLKLAQTLVTEDVVATLGFCNTGVAQKALEVFQGAKQPLIIPCATGTPLTTRYPAPESYIFRTSASDGIQAPFLVDDLVKRGWTKVAIFADSTGYGDAGLKDIEAALAAKNLKAVYVSRFAIGTKDLRDELKAARDAGANVVVSYAVGPESAVIANGRKALNWKVPQAGAWTLSFPFFIDGAKDAAEGALTVQTFIAEPSNERRRAFLSAYATKYGKRLAVPMAAAQGYDSTYLLLYALFGIRDGNLSGPAVKAALENISRIYYGVIATYQHPFGPNDKEAMSQNMLVMGEVRNGAVTFAYPEDAKRNLMVQRKK